RAATTSAPRPSAARSADFGELSRAGRKRSRTLRKAFDLGQREESPLHRDAPADLEHADDVVAGFVNRIDDHLVADRELVVGRNLEAIEDLGAELIVLIVVGGPAPGAAEAHHVG